MELHTPSHTTWPASAGQGSLPTTYMCGFADMSSAATVPTVHHLPISTRQEANIRLCRRRRLALAWARRRRRLRTSPHGLSTTTAVLLSPPVLRELPRVLLQAPHQHLRLRLLLAPAFLQTLARHRPRLKATSSRLRRSPSRSHPSRPTATRTATGATSMSTHTARTSCAGRARTSRSHPFSPSCPTLRT